MSILFIYLVITFIKIWGNDAPKYAPSISINLFLGKNTSSHLGQYNFTLDTCISSVNPTGNAFYLSQYTLGHVPYMPFSNFNLTQCNPLFNVIFKEIINKFKFIKPNGDKMNLLCNNPYKSTAS